MAAKKEKSEAKANSEVKPKPKTKKEPVSLKGQDGDVTATATKGENCGVTAEAKSKILTPPAPPVKKLRSILHRRSSSASSSSSFGVSSPIPGPAPPPVRGGGGEAAQNGAAAAVHERPSDRPPPPAEYYRAGYDGYAAAAARASSYYYYQQQYQHQRQHQHHAQQHAQQHLPYEHRRRHQRSHPQYHPHYQHQHPHHQYHNYYYAWASNAARGHGGRGGGGWYGQPFRPLYRASGGGAYPLTGGRPWRAPEPSNQSQLADAQQGDSGDGDAAPPARPIRSSADSEKDRYANALLLAEVSKIAKDEATRHASDRSTASEETAKRKDDDCEIAPKRQRFADQPQGSTQASPIVRAKAVTPQAAPKEMLRAVSVEEQTRTSAIPRLRTGARDRGKSFFYPPNVGSSLCSPSVRQYRIGPTPANPCGAETTALSDYMPPTPSFERGPPPARLVEVTPNHIDNHSPEQMPRPPATGGGKQTRFDEGTERHQEDKMQRRRRQMAERHPGQQAVAPEDAVGQDLFPPFPSGGGWGSSGSTSSTGSRPTRPFYVSPRPTRESFDTGASSPQSPFHAYYDDSPKGSLSRSPGREDGQPADYNRPRAASATWGVSSSFDESFDRPRTAGSPRKGHRSKLSMEYIHLPDANPDNLVFTPRSSFDRFLESPPGSIGESTGFLSSPPGAFYDDHADYGRGPPPPTLLPVPHSVTRQFETPPASGAGTKYPPLAAYQRRPAVFFPYGEPPQNGGKTIIRRKTPWKHFPQLEQFLIANRDEYLRHSAKNYTSEQRQYNNRLTERLLSVAARHGYSFDEEDFDFVTVRDRIRCYYKSYVQSKRKKGIEVGYSGKAKKARGEVALKGGQSEDKRGTRKTPVAIKSA